LEEAIQSIVDYINENKISAVILLGHSYGGMIITGVADKIPDRIHRLIYWNAFVPNNGESLNSMVPQMYIDFFTQLEKPDGSVELPFPIWREAFIRPLAKIVKSAIFLAERPLNSLAYTNSKASLLLSLGLMQEVY
jgi:pimeloyl-ACP methyl ester carboxylesterase